MVEEDEDDKRLFEMELRDVVGTPDGLEVELGFGLGLVVGMNWLLGINVGTLSVMSA